MPIDYSTYCDDWHLRSRFIRFYRARNKCEWCGAENYKSHPYTGSKVILTVAHLDQDKTNNSFFNLAALCQRCHLNHDREHHIKKRRENRYKDQMDLFEPKTCSLDDDGHGFWDTGCGNTIHEHDADFESEICPYCKRGR